MGNSESRNDVYSNPTEDEVREVHTFWKGYSFEETITVPTEEEELELLEKLKPKLSKKEVRLQNEASYVITKVFGLAKRQRIFAKWDGVINDLRSARQAQLAELETFKEVLKQGLQLIKHGRKLGSIKEKIFVLNEDGYLTWKKGRFSQGRSILLCGLSNVYAGHRSPIFQQEPHNASSPYTTFSLVFENELLSLEASTEEDRDHLVHGFQLYHHYEALKVFVDDNGILRKKANVVKDKRKRISLRVK